MFRALVTASALLTATLAAVLFMPGVGREGGGGPEGGEGTTGALLRSGELDLSAEYTVDLGTIAGAGEAGLIESPEPDAPVAEARLSERPDAPGESMAAEPVAEAAPEAAVDQAAVEQAQEQALAGPLADEAALAASVALSAPARDADARPPHAPQAQAVPAVAAAVTPPEVAGSALPATTAGGADDLQALSAGVLAGFGLGLAEAPATDPATALVGAGVAQQPVRGQQWAAAGSRQDDAGWITDYVLIGLGKGPRKVTTALQDAQERSTAYVLNGLGADGAARQPPGAPVSLENAIAGAIAEGRSDDYLIALIDQLSAAGQLDAPAALLRPDGQVDTRLVLNALVSASTAASTSAATPAPRPQRQRLGRAVTYTVRPGDSLAAIAYRFYGLTSRYTEIFEANRAELPSPNRIRAGQRLTIPAG